MTEPARCEWVTGQQPLPLLGDWLTVAETATQLNVSIGVIYKLCKAGGLPHTRVGQQIRIPQGRLVAWLLEQDAAR